jgi:hypothetical protein
MFTLLKPGGILVCEDGDLTRCGRRSRLFPNSALREEAL